MATARMYQEPTGPCRPLTWLSVIPSKPQTEIVMLASLAFFLWTSAWGGTSAPYGPDALTGALVVRATVAKVEYDGSSSITTNTLDIKEVLGGEYDGSVLVVHTSVDRRRWPTEEVHDMVMYEPPREGEEITFSCTKYVPLYFKSFGGKVYCRQSLDETFFRKVTLPDGREIVADALFSAVPAVSPNGNITDFTQFTHQGEKCGDQHGCFLGEEKATAWVCGDCINTAASWDSFLEAFKTLVEDPTRRGSLELSSTLRTATLANPARAPQ